MVVIPPRSTSNREAFFGWQHAWRDTLPGSGFHQRKGDLENVNASHGCFQSPQNHTKSMYNISYTDTYTIIACKLKNIYIRFTLNSTSCCRNLKTPSCLLTIQKLTKQNPIYVETICHRSAHSLLPVLCKSTRNVGSVKTWFNMVQRTESNQKCLLYHLDCASLPKSPAKVQPSDSKFTELAILDHVFQCFAINAHSTLVKGQVVPSPANNRQTTLCVRQDQVHGVLEIILSWSSLSRDHAWINRKPQLLR